MINYNAIVEDIKKITIEASKKIIDVYNSFDFEIEAKDDRSPVTKADKIANNYIVQEVKRLYPDFGVLSEESRDTMDRFERQHVWVIDPLDGTKEFIKKNGEFTVNIGLVKNGEPVLGVVGIPARGEYYFASKDNGAFYQNKEGQVSGIKCSSHDRIEKMTLVKSRSHASEKIGRLIEKYKFAAVKERGSSIKICLIASGLADVYYRFGMTNEWDICAAHAILNEAGGRMSDCQGNRITYNKKDTLNKNGFIASNNMIHNRLIEIANESA